MPRSNKTTARRQENQSIFRYRTSGTSRGRAFQCVPVKCGFIAVHADLPGISLSHISVSICTHIADWTIAHIRIHRPVHHIPRVAPVAVHARVHISRARIAVYVRRVVIGRRTHVRVHHVRIA
jgi:hypothetical protein